MKISNRLQLLAHCLSKQKIIADIGSDHGYLCVYYMLYCNGKKAYACDINRNALNQAKQTLTKNPSVAVELQCMDGIQQLHQDVQEIVIAGMGYDTIRSILENQEEKIARLDRIVIQCNKNLDKMQQFLSAIQLPIIETHLVFENGLYYEIYVCSQKYPTVLKTIAEDALYQQYLNFKIAKIEQTPHFETIQKLKEKHEKLTEAIAKIKT